MNTGKSTRKMTQDSKEPWKSETLESGCIQSHYRDVLSGVCMSMRTRRSSHDESARKRVLDKCCSFKN